MAEKKKNGPKGYADGIPVYCAHDAIVPIGELKPNPKNPNKHPTQQIERLGAIIRGNGWRNPITVSKRSGFIVKGHGRLLAAELEELAEVPVDFQDYDSEAAELADLTADNRIAELAERDEQLLVDAFKTIAASDLDFGLSGYTQEESEKLAAALSSAFDTDDDGSDDAAPEPPATPVTRRGDIWILGGKHRVMCGDCTNADNKAALLDGAMPQILMTDPPYCSGGSKESDKARGSIGTMRADGKLPMIENDILSTRGYQNLISKALADIPCLYSYIFTDWRMWVYLFDLTESAGFGVKSMIVWNKKTPGMGSGWRSQHELICFGARQKTHFDGHKGYGNVIECSRTNNELHETQKPLELFEQLLDNTDFARGVYDPFGGSGPTMAAAEKLGQESYTMELKPKYVDVIVRRYIELTGDKDGVKLIRRGEEAAPEEYAGIFASVEA